LALGQLQDDLVERDAVAMEDALQLTDLERLGLERPRGEVDADVDALLHLADAARDHVEAEEVELDRPVDGLRRLEHRARIAEWRRLRRSDEALVADRPPGRHREDRLVDR